MWIEKPLAIAVLKVQAQKTLHASDRLSDFLAVVRDPYNFSQAPFWHDSAELRLLATNAVARWLADQYETGQYLPL